MGVSKFNITTNFLVGTILKGEELGRVIDLFDLTEPILLVSRNTENGRDRDLFRLYGSRTEDEFPFILRSVNGLHYWISYFDEWAEYVEEHTRLSFNLITPLGAYSLHDNGRSSLPNNTSRVHNTKGVFDDEDESLNRWRSEVEKWELMFRCAVCPPHNTCQKTLFNYFGSID